MGRVWDVIELEFWYFLCGFGCMRLLFEVNNFYYVISYVFVDEDLMERFRLFVMMSFLISDGYGK